MTKVSGVSVQVSVFWFKSSMFKGSEVTKQKTDDRWNRSV